MGKKLQLYLMTSYLYYVMSQSVIQDAEYDQLAQELLSGWEAFEHPHKHLVTPADLTAGTLYSLKEADYPKMVVGAALLLLQNKGLENGKINMGDA